MSECHGPQSKPWLDRELCVQLFPCRSGKNAFCQRQARESKNGPYLVQNSIRARGKQERLCKDGWRTKGKRAKGRRLCELYGGIARERTLLPSSELQSCFGNEWEIGKTSDQLSLSTSCALSSGIRGWDLSYWQRRKYIPKLNSGSNATSESPR